MTLSVLFLLASLGVVNGILVGVYLIVKKKRAITDVYFGGLLLTLSIRIGKSIFFYFNRGTDLLILQIGLSACIFIGPFFYLYIKAIEKQEQNFQLKDKLLLFTLLIAITITGVLFPYRTFPEVWNGYIIYGIYAVWSFFTILGLYYSSKLLGPTIFSPKSMNGSEQYLAAIVLSMLFITCTYQAALFIGFTYIWGALIFTFTFYYLLGRVLLTSKSITPKLSIRPLENGTDLLNKINEWMSSEKPFINQGLKLDLLASQTNMSKHTLSRVLNEEYKHGFSQYVKEHRVNEAKKLIGSRPELSLEGVGYEAGFSSKSAFFDAFKKIEHCTPSEYKKSI